MIDIAKLQLNLTNDIDNYVFALEAQLAAANTREAELVTSLKYTLGNIAYIAECASAYSIRHHNLTEDLRAKAEMYQSILDTISGKAAS